MRRSSALVSLVLSFVTGIAACDGGGGGAGGGDGGSDDGGIGGGTGGGAGGGGANAAVACNDGSFGLYADAACTEIAPGIEAFQPRFTLWTDGATKERYVALPAGATIDTSNPDGWVFPVGTRIWKTFLVDGVRMETRLLEKVQAGTGLAAWDFVAFAWNAAQDAVTAVPSGVSNTLGTDHDIPSTSDCTQCHAPGATDMALGFSAIQLNHAVEGSVTLASLNASGRLSAAIDTADAEVPGDDVEQAALGYLHANCSHCHGGTQSWGAGGTRALAPLHMRLRVADTTLEETATYTTAVNVYANWRPAGGTTELHRVYGGDLAQSAIYQRMNVRDPLSTAQMPRLGTEVVDPAGLETIATWIGALPAPSP